MLGLRVWDFGLGFCAVPVSVKRFWDLRFRAFSLGALGLRGAVKGCEGSQGSPD